MPGVEKSPPLDLATGNKFLGQSILFKNNPNYHQTESKQITPNHPPLFVFFLKKCEFAEIKIDFLNYKIICTIFVKKCNSCCVTMFNHAIAITM
jgi:hypothetical protein